MTSINRRRFLAISASAACLGTRATADGHRQWSGVGLGARMTLTLAHPDAERIAERAFAEIDRLENIFSLYRARSALSRLNAKGVLADPPFELLECLSLCGGVHRVTGGLFDPTVQPLWQLHAAAWSEGHSPSADDIAATRAKTGWDRITISPTELRLPAGMSLTLNGIAQGYVADRVADLLSREGLTDILVDTGEHFALGGDWPVMIDAGRLVGPHRLRDKALASSAPLGTTFDEKGRAGHILDPRTGRPALPRWRIVSVTSSSAAMADALSTAAVLMTRAELDVLFRHAAAALVLAEPS